jgi:hypothetical protein
VRYDIVFDWGWKIQRLIAFWETRYQLDKPIGAQSSEAESTVRGIEVTVRIAGGGATVEGIAEPIQQSCARFIRMTELYGDTLRPAAHSVY